MEDAVLSVRSLDDWTPGPSAPPTSRLLLDLEGIGAGKAHRPERVPIGAKASGLWGVNGPSSNTECVPTNRSTDWSTNRSREQMSVDRPRRTLNTNSGRPPLSKKADAKLKASRSRHKLLPTDQRSCRPTDRSEAQSDILGGSASRVPSGREVRNSGRMAAAGGLTQRLTTKFASKSSAIRKVFRDMDLNKDGTVSPREFHDAMHMLGVQLKPEELQAVMRKVDADGSGDIAYSEFCSAFLESDSSTELNGFGANRHARRVGGRKRVPAAHPDHEVIVPDLNGELNREERRKLRAQMKVLDKMAERCHNSNDVARRMLSLFRQCDPDEFGFVSRAKFVQGLERHYGLSRNEADRLFAIGNSQGRDELNYHAFREALKRVDNKTDEKPTPYRPMLRRKRVDSGATDGESSTRNSPTKGSSNFGEMSRSARDEFRDRNRIMKLIERSKHELQEKFHERKQGRTSTSVRTKLSFGEVESLLDDFGVNMPATTIRKLYGGGESGSGTSREGITFSQLCRKTVQYFNELQGGGPSSGKSAAKSMSLRGQFLGCRAQGEGSASKNPHPQETRVSDFLSHVEEAPGFHGRNRRSRRRLRNVEEKAAAEAFHSPLAAAAGGFGTNEGKPQTGRDESARTGRGDETEREEADERILALRNKQHLWKSRWTDKTLEQRRRKGLGGNRRGEPEYAKHMHGSGNILSWEIAPAAGLPSSRNTTARSGRRRALGSSQSAPLLTSPFAVDI